MALAQRCSAAWRGGGELSRAGGDEGALLVCKQGSRTAGQQGSRAAGQAQAPEGEAAARAGGLSWGAKSGWSAGYATTDPAVFLTSLYEPLEAKGALGQRLQTSRDCTRRRDYRG
jgi:hypothetical protein